MYLHVWMRLSKILLVGFTFTYLHEQRLLHLKARDGDLGNPKLVTRSPVRSLVTLMEYCEGIEEPLSLHLS